MNDSVPPGTAVAFKGEEKAGYVTAMFERIARRYDLLNTVMTAGRHRVWRRWAVDVALGRRVGSGHRSALIRGAALDIATGTGDLALELAGRPGAGPVVGVDIVPGMLALARAKAAQKSQEDGPFWVLGDALHLPFADNAFDCAVCGFSLRNVTDIRQALREMARVVRPGGRVVTLELTPLRRGSLRSRLIRFYFRRVVPLLGAILAGDHEAYTYLPLSVDRFPPARRLVTLFSEAGLAPVQYRKFGMGSVALHWGIKPEAETSQAASP